MYNYDRKYSWKFEKMYEFEKSWDESMGIILYIWTMGTIFSIIWSFAYGQLLPFFALLAGILVLLLSSIPNLVRLFWSKYERREYKRYLAMREESKDYWESRRRGYGG